MSVIPVSRLSCADLALLGNNVRPSRRRDIAGGAATSATRRRRRAVAAVNRSLAGYGERVPRLHPPYAAFAAA